MEISLMPGDWLIFQKDMVLVKSKFPLTLPKAEDTPLFIDRLLSRGELSAARGGYLWGEYPPEEELPWGFEPVGLRELWGLGGDLLFQSAGTAFQFMDWQRSSRFCSRCGGPMVPGDENRAFACEACGYLSYPVITPAVIVAVTKEDKLLLARSFHFPKGRYSVLAGFVEPGESLEETVRREILEEVSIKVRDVNYFGSQPWPFPHSLMLGFTARWEEGEITPDGKEIEDAGWYTRETLPDMPPSNSISRQLINSWLDRVQQPRHEKGAQE